MKKVNILWTSGWDSTFRLMQLLEKGEVKIQPYYIIDENRASTDIEIKKMNEIINMSIEKWNHCKELILPIKYINKNKINEYSNIINSFNKLKKQSFIGSQYEWLGCVSHDVKELELCIHEDDKAHAFIKDYVVQKGDIEGKFYTISEDADEDVLNVFGNYKFPILDYTKLDMMKEAEEKNFKDIMMNTWFCHTPINGEACGKCNPCIYTIEEGMKFRLSEKALKRYKNRNKILNKIKAKIKTLLK
ncbi:hypothetical protein [uncultured Clostridium sp.]|uniref:hypothetical protein n=1 Tax=uncultured Clostridium sp. TaxID=59620 RepID=UPI0025948AC2|nr:hypothetical protein [uncultured Clostridium sp.]